MSCIFVITSGPREGNPCGKKLNQHCLNNNIPYCVSHLRSQTVQRKLIIEDKVDSNIVTTIGSGNINKLYENTDSIKMFKQALKDNLTTSSESENVPEPVNNAPVNNDESNHVEHVDEDVEPVSEEDPKDVEPVSNSTSSDDDTLSKHDDELNFFMKQVSYNGFCTFIKTIEELKKLIIMYSTASCIEDSKLSDKGLISRSTIDFQLLMKNCKDEILYLFSLIRTNYGTSRRFDEVYCKTISYISKDHLGLIIETEDLDEWTNYVCQYYWKNI